MKKILLSLLVVFIALGAKAQGYYYKNDGGELTVFKGTPTNTEGYTYIESLSDLPTFSNIATLKLEGDFNNTDGDNISTIVGKCGATGQNPLGMLDLSACGQITSKFVSATDNNTANQDNVTFVFDPEGQNNGGLNLINIRDYIKGISLPDNDNFTGISNTYFQGWNNLETVIIPEGVKAIGNNAFQNCTKLKNVNFPSTLEELGGDAFQNCKELESVDLSDTQLTQIRYATFNDCEKLSSVEYPTNLKRIGRVAFKKCNLSEVVLPASVEEICYGAFTDDKKSIQKVVLQPSSDHPFVIHSNAFMNAESIKDVYINTPIYTINGVTYPICEVDAFNYETTDGQTSVENMVNGIKGAKLHLPECDASAEYANFEWFVGHYKEGLTVIQSNLINSRNHAEGKDLQDPEYTQLRTTHSGWWQFFMNDVNSIEIKKNEDFIRTFSDNTPWVLPIKWEKTDKNNVNNSSSPYYGKPYKEIDGDQNNVLVNMGELMQAYRVIDVVCEGNVENGEGNSPESCTVTAKRIPEYIPSETGVILRSQQVGEATIIYLDKFDGTEKKYPYNSDTNDPDVNLLQKSITPVQVYPVEKVGGKAAYRNFGFTTAEKYGASKTNPKFVRLKPGKTKENRAFLHLTAEQFPYTNEDDNNVGVSFDETASTSISILGFEDFEIVSPVDAINDMVTTKHIDNNGIYTLQGVRIDKPSNRGIYIMNGKKVVVK